MLFEIECTKLLQNNTSIAIDNQIETQTQHNNNINNNNINNIYDHNRNLLQSLPSISPTNAPSFSQCGIIVTPWIFQICKNGYVYNAQHSIIIT